MSITENVVNMALAHILHAPEMVVTEMHPEHAIVHNTASGRDYVCAFGNDSNGPFIRIKNECAYLHLLNAASQC